MPCLFTSLFPISVNFDTGACFEEGKGVCVCVCVCACVCVCKFPCSKPSTNALFGKDTSQACHDGDERVTRAHGAAFFCSMQNNLSQDATSISRGKGTPTFCKIACPESLASISWQACPFSQFVFFSFSMA